MEGQEAGESNVIFANQHLKTLTMNKDQGFMDKIELDSRQKEKTSFATLGRGQSQSSSSSGINITYSDDKEGGDYSKSRRGSTKEFWLNSSPATPSKSRGLSPSLLDKGEEDLLGNQLNSVRMKLEERRKRIEEEKQKMELVMAKQREKVGQEAFLRAVAKGIKKAGNGQMDGVEGAKNEILELASRVGGEKGLEGERRARPFSLHLQSGGNGQGDVKTPDMEALDISRMSDSLYELQNDIQKLAVQQTQIQNMMKQASPQQQQQQSAVRTEQKSQQPFFISNHSSSQTSQPPFFISQPERNLIQPQPESQPYFQPQQPPQVSWGQPLPTSYQQSNYESQQRPPGYDNQSGHYRSQSNPTYNQHQPMFRGQPPPTFFDHQGQPVYDNHPQRPQQYLDQFGRPFRDQWGNPLTVHPPTNPATIQPHQHSQQPLYVAYNQSLNQTYPPINHAPYQTQLGFTSQAQPYNPPSSFTLPSKYSEHLDSPQNSNPGSPYHRASLSRNSSLRRSQSRSSPHRTQRISVHIQQEEEAVDESQQQKDEMEPQKVSFVAPSEAKEEPEVPRPKITLVPKRDESPCKPPMSEKPSLSTSFLEQKRRNFEQQQHIKTQPRPPPAPSPSFIENQEGNSEEKVEEIPEELSRSTLETLNTMKTEEMKDKKDSKGFVISFGDETPVKPKPTLKPRRSSKKSEDLDERSTNSVISNLKQSFSTSVNIDPDLETSQVSGASLKDTFEDCTPDSPAGDFFMDSPDLVPCHVCEGKGGNNLVCEGKFSLCGSCFVFLERTKNMFSDEPETLVCLGGMKNCIIEGNSTNCTKCFIDKIKAIGLLRDLEEVKNAPSPADAEKELLEIERKKEWVIMMAEKRKQQVEESRIKREEEARKKREDEEAKREETLRKKEEDKKRREEIFQQYKIKKEMEKAKEEGRNLFAAPTGPKMRPKSAGGNRPRPRTIHGEKDDIGLNQGRPMRGSQSNIAITGAGDGLRSGGRLGVARRGSNASLQDEPDTSLFGGSLRGLGHIGRSKSSSASNLGPGSLPLGIRSRGGRGDFDDNASDVSSTTSGYRSGRGSAKLFREPVSKSNRPIILNAVEYVVMPGVVNKEARARVLEEIERCDCPHFLILFRDSKLQFRGLYAYYPDTEEVFKIYGTGPRQVTDNMMDRFYKYNSGGKKFTQIHTKHLTVTIDAFTIHNQLWLGKKTKLPDKKDLALVI